MKLRCKLWMEKNGEQVFGEGIYRLLVFVDKHGSINKASQEENMSYRQAWGKIKQIEDRLGVKLLHRRIGGKSGGGAELTREGKKLVKIYKNIISKSEKFLKQLSKDIDKDL